MWWFVECAALVVTEEENRGNQDWAAWRDILHLFDIICCCAILFPIVWSIKSLREAAATVRLLASSPLAFPFFVETWLWWCQDGKAAVNAEKLTLFRQFYMMVRANSANATTKRPAERCGCCCGTGGELHLLHEDHRVLVRLDAPLAPGLGDHCRHAGPTHPPSPALQGHAAARSLTHCTVL